MLHRLTTSANMEKFIESFRDLDTSQKVIYAVGGVVVTVVSAVIIRKLLHKEEKKVYPRDTVILRQVGRGPHAPSMTPFAVKLETYLRMARIPYQNVHGFTPSKKGKFPWMEYNGEAVADTTLCIDFLNKKLSIDLNKHLRPTERGIAQSMQVMTEEHLYWILVLFRWQYDNDKTMMHQFFKINKFLWWMFQRNLKKMLWAQGLGRHTEGEVTQMMYKDLQALEDYIGQKKFLMGDEPCETDCAVFGQLSQFYWQFIGTGHDTLIKDKYPKLAAYCERMKTTFWPDWDDCNTRGGTRKAPK